jgi:hypothetical protein
MDKGGNVKTLPLFADIDNPVDLVNLISSLNLYLTVPRMVTHLDIYVWTGDPNWHANGSGISNILRVYYAKQHYLL